VIEIWKFETVKEMATAVWSNSDIGSILTAQGFTRDPYLIFSPEIATIKCPTNQSFSTHLAQA